MKKEDPTSKKKKVTFRQAAAMTGVILLVLLYLVTLAAAILDSSASAQWFRACLGATIALPLLIWIYTWIYGKVTQRPDISVLETSEPQDAETSRETDIENSPTAETKK